MHELNFSYALFDMDGTLVDSMFYWRHLVDEFLEDEGIALTDEQCRAIESMPTSASIPYLRSLHLPPRADALTKEDLLAILLRHYEKDVRCKPGVVAFLEELRQKGVKMGIATLTPTPLAQVCLARTGIASYFSFILGGEEYPEGKRSSRIFLDAAEKFGCAPQQMVLFEDSYYSIDTARKLDISVVGVFDEWQAHNRERIIDASVAFFQDGFTLRIK